MEKDAIQKLASDLSQAFAEVETEAHKLSQAAAAHGFDISTLLTAIEGMAGHVQQVGTIPEPDAGADAGGEDDLTSHPTSSGSAPEGMNAPDETPAPVDEDTPGETSAV